MKGFGNIACMLLSGWFLAGCITEAPIQKKITDARIELVDNDEFSMGLLSCATKIDDFGLLTVDASVVLSRTSPWKWIWGGDPKIEVGYRFQWMDAKGNVHESAKHTISSLPGNIISIHGVAPSEKEVSFKLRIFLNGQEPKPAAKTEAAKPAPKAETAKPAGKTEPKAKTEVSPAAVAPAVKPEPKAEAKPTPKAEAKPAPAAPAVKTEPKAEAAKPAGKADPKADAAKPAPKPAKLTEPFE